jgi:RHS repeat-associated protein
MKLRASAVASRGWSTLRRWLQQAWISRVALDWWEDVRDWFRPEETKTRRRATPLAIEPYETRWVPNDVWGMLGAPLLGTGVAYLGTNFLTPAAVLAHGWSGGRSLNDALGAEALAATVGVAAPAAARPDEALAAAQTFAGLAIPGSAGSGSEVMGTTAPAAVPLTATWPELGGPSLFTASDPLHDPLADNLSGVSAALRTTEPPSAPAGTGGGGDGGGSGSLAPSTNLSPYGTPPAPAGSADSYAYRCGRTGSLGSPVSGTPRLASSSSPTSSSPSAPVLSASGGGPSASDKLVRPNLATNFGRSLALPFEQNVGQTNAQVKYLARGPGFGLFLTGNAAALALARPGTSAGPSQPATRDVIKLQFAGANSNPQVVGQQELPSRSNYFSGNDPSKWLANVTQYGQVAYHNLYAGVDLVYYGNANRQLEYDFVVAPGADPSQVHLSFQGVASPQLDAQGNVLLGVGGRSVMQQAPGLYQLSNNTRQTVSGGYVLNADGTIGFQVGTYDHSKPLYLDPVLSYSSYLGGSGDDYAYAVGVDQAGNTVIAGSTSSTNFPSATGSFAGGASDGFVAKLNAAGNAIIYSTYLGGSAVDQVNGLALDPAGDAYLVGTTSSTNFPTTSGAYQTTWYGTKAAFVAELNVTGDTLLFSTFLGSQSSPGTFADGRAIALDSVGRVVVTGAVGSDFSPTGGVLFQPGFGGGTSNAFVARLAADGTMQKASFLGGDGAAIGTAIAVDSQANVYVAGSTANWTSNPFPTTSGAYQTAYGGGAHDDFVTEVNANFRSLAYSTLLGGAGDDQANAIAVDSNGNAYVGGSTTGSFPTTTGAAQTTYGGGTSNAFVTKVAAGGSSLSYSSYVGGSGADVAYGLALDSAGSAVLTGETSSTNFPTLNAPYSSNAGGNDAFLTKVKTDGSGWLYSTYLGGSQDDAGQAVALDWAGNPTVVGWTKSSNFPTIGGPLQGTNAGGVDAFAARLGLKPPPPVFTGVSPDTGSSSSDQITTSQNLTLSGTATPSGTVTISRAGVGILGSVTANATSGTWTYDYTGTTLPEGTYAFTATVTAPVAQGGLTSAPTAPEFLVVVDRTAPSVTVTAPATTASLQPQIRVTASDLNGLPNGTAVTLLVYNSTGTTLLGTYSNAATLTDGVASFREPMTLTAGTTYQFKAQVTDLAGNQATSTGASVSVTTVSSPWVPTGQVLASDPLTGQAEQQLGDLQLAAPLDLDQSPGTTQSGNAALVYNSDAVSVKPIIQVSLPSNNNAALPSTITGTLTWDTAGANSTSALSFSTSGDVQGDVLTLAAQVPSAVTTTKRYGWKVDLTTPAGTQTVTGSVFVVALDSSALGAGWTYGPADRLVSIASDSTGPAGMLRLYGIGGYRFYQGTSSFTSPAGDNGTLTLSGGTYTYTTPDNQTWTFNSSGYQTAWTSGDGHETLQYRYDGSNRLSGVTAIDGALATFTYSSGQVAIAATTGTTTLTLSGSDLTSVTNPDGGVQTFTYDGSHHLTGEQLANVQNGWAYSSVGALATLTWGGSGSPSVSQLTPAAARGLSAPFVGTLAATLTDPLSHVTSWQLDGQGRVLQQLAADGGLTQYQRDSNGRVTQVTDPLNRITTYTLDSLGYVTQQKLPDGNTQNFAYQSAFHALTTFTNERNYTTTYAYDSQGHRTSVTDPLNHTTTYSYYSSGAQAGLLQSVTDPLNHTVTYQYDSQRRQTTVTDALNNVTSYSYDSNGNPLTVTDALVRVTTTNYDVMGRETSTVDALGNTTTMTYNAADLLLTSVDALGHTASAVYDSSGRGLPATSSNAVGTPVQNDNLASYDNAGQISGSRNADGYWTNAAYDPVGRVIKTTNALGGLQRTVYDLAGQVIATRDELGRWTTYQYNSRGWLTQQTDPLGNSTAYGYDAAGNRTTVTDPLSHVTSYAYDALNRQTVVTDPLNHSTTTVYDAAGNVSTVTDPLSHVTSYAYDAVNRRTTTTDAVGTSVQRTSSTAYDKVGNVTSVTDGLGHVTSYSYDALNRRTATTDALGHTTTAVYDSVGNATTVTDPLSKVTSYAYDALNRQVQATDPLAHVTTMVVDAQGQQVGTQDALNDVSLTGINALGQTAGTLDPKAGLTQKFYDGAGNLIELIDPVGNTTNFVYDGLNREILRTDPLGKTVTTSYDAAGRMTSVTDRDGRQILYSYDNANRLTGETWKDNTGTTVNLQTYTYDNKNNLLTAADSSGTYTNSYDALDRLQSQQNLFGLTLTYTYDAADRLTQRQDSLNGVLTSVYDNVNRLTSRQFGGTGQTPLRVDPAYDNRNELTSLTRYSDVAGSTLVGTTVYSYDDSSRVTSIVNQNASAVTLSYYNYGYDNADRITSETWQSGSTPGSRSYNYDSTNQLTNDGTTTYTYDLTGNRTMSGYQTSTDNRLSNDGTFTYTYDNEGNLTQKSKGSGLETWYFGYDNLNHLTSVRQTSDGSTNLLLVTYTYDVFGQRATEAKWKSGGSTVTTRFAYDGQQVWAELNTSNVVQTRYVYGDGQAQLFARIDVGSGVRWELTDHLGSVRDVVDATGATILDHLDYDGFGKLTETNAANGGRITYAGYAYDRDAGLAKAGERYYAPATARWLQQDPIVFRAGDANLYRYVGNRATNATDPTGLEEQDTNPWAPLFSAPPGQSGLHWTGKRWVHVYVPEPGSLLNPVIWTFNPKTGVETAVVVANPEEPINLGPDWNRIGGFFQAIWGGVETLFGGGLVLTPEATGLTKVGGAIIATDGVDNWTAGWNRVINGGPPKSYIATYTSQGLQGLGVDPGTANYLGGATKAVTGGFSTLAIPAYQVWGVPGVAPALPPVWSTVATTAAEQSTFYHGTSRYVAMEMVDNQAVNIERLAAHQADKAFAKGLYLSSEEATANYYSDLLFATGRAGGPSIVKVEVPTQAFNDFAAARNIAIGAPVPRPPVPGQTETFIPMQSVPDFNNLPGIQFTIHK